MIEVTKFERFRLDSEYGERGNPLGGIFYFPASYHQIGPLNLRVIASNGDGWDHVSVSTASRVPSWQEMCWVKERFWREEDCVMQLHPPRSQYVNWHPHVLHLWRPHDQQIPRPPIILV